MRSKASRASRSGRSKKCAVSSGATGPPPEAAADSPIRRFAWSGEMSPRRSLRLDTTLASWSRLPGQCAAASVVSVAGGSDNPPMPRLPASARLAEIAQVAAAEMGFRVGENLSGGVSDANYCAAQGVPTLDGLGPVGGQDHSPAEYLEVESIVPRVAMLARLLQLIAEEAPTLRALRPASL